MHTYNNYIYNKNSEQRMEKMTKSNPPSTSRVENVGNKKCQVEK